MKKRNLVYFLLCLFHRFVTVLPCIALYFEGTKKENADIIFLKLFQPIYFLSIA
ncbi:MAG: hypothetical protein IPL04_17720 [Chitinophagaceae bacterium]|nr:hypothetical protein [Chitinophagaceae bacterium]